MEISVRNLLNAKIKENDKEQVTLFALIAEHDEVTIYGVKEVRGYAGGKNYMCYLEPESNAFFFSNAPTKRIIEALLKQNKNFFADGEVLTIKYEMREVLGKITAMPVEVL